MNAHPIVDTAASNHQSGIRLALVGLAVNVAFAFIKITAGVFGNAYALIADQTPKHKNDPRHWTRFLGQETAFFKGAGKIAQFLDARVLYVTMRRVRRGYYSVRLSVLADPPYELDANEMIVERYARSLERDIRESPADWLWFQNKWKVARPPEGASAPAAKLRRAPDRNGSQ